MAHTHAKKSTRLPAPKVHPLQAITIKLQCTHGVNYTQISDERKVNLLWSLGLAIIAFKKSGAVRDVWDEFVRSPEHSIPPGFDFKELDDQKLIDVLCDQHRVISGQIRSCVYFMSSST